MTYSVPTIGDFVYARVTRISRSRGAECLIFALNLNPLGRELKGTVRINDVTAPDLVIAGIENAFRPGDVIRAKIISLGDSRNYFLSTVADDCGVVFGVGSLEPASFRLMFNRRDKSVVERRKVAKPVWLATL